jgi:glutaminyl-peptide cyclotransferase
MRAPHRLLTWLIVALLWAGAGASRSDAEPTSGGGPAGVQGPRGALDGAAIYRHLEAQCAFGPRVPGSAAHQTCADYIARHLEAAGGRVTRQSFLHTAPGLAAPVELTNILARFGPGGEGGLLLGSHWDSRPWADQDPDPNARLRPVLGANDGASSAAVLLALADYLAERPPDIPVLLAFFDGEDLGRAGMSEEYLAGSRYLASHMPSPFPPAAVILDMVGSESMVLAVEEQSRILFPDMAGLIDGIAAEVGTLAYVPEAGPSVLDDHVPFIEVGLAAVLLIDFRDPVWHTLQDTPAHCSPGSLEQTARLAERLVFGGYFR